MLSKTETDFIISELSGELNAKRDGSGKNLIAERCPFCGKEKKFGIYIGKETERKKTFVSHCFSCGYSTYTLEQLLNAVGRPDLIALPTTNLDTYLDNTMLFPLEEEEIDDSLGIVELPEFNRRVFTNQYLKARGFTFNDYEYFPVYTTHGLNRKFDNYVIFAIVDNEDIVGYVARHISSKKEIDAHNRKAKYNGEYRIMRFKNSIENEFTKLLYNYDSIIKGDTDTVIVVEGIFDVIALTRKLDLYDNRLIAIIATFGKKISLQQIYKLQVKGIKTIVIGYDGDAVEAIKRAADALATYFSVFIADIQDVQKDWEDLNFEEIYTILSYRLRTPVEYKLLKVQEQK
ncbi:toprim domain-containing protein [Bacteroides fragilis]|nr:toprim domain-containing protein [Bacteroides fragilis]